MKLKFKQCLGKAFLKICVLCEVAAAAAAVGGLNAVSSLPWEAGTVVSLSGRWLVQKGESLVIPKHFSYIGKCTSTMASGQPPNQHPTCSNASSSTHPSGTH